MKSTCYFRSDRERYIVDMCKHKTKAWQGMENSKPKQENKPNLANKILESEHRTINSRQRHRANISLNTYRTNDETRDTCEHLTNQPMTTWQNRKVNTRQDHMTRTGDHMTDKNRNKKQTPNRDNGKCSHFRLT